MCDCPQCGFGIEIDDPWSSVGDVYRCPGCGAELDLQSSMDQDWDDFPEFYFEVLVPGNIL